MKKILIILLLNIIAIAPVLATNWQLLGHTSDNSLIYIDRSSIQVSSGLGFIRYKQITGDKSYLIADVILNEKNKTSTVYNLEIYSAKGKFLEAYGSPNRPPLYSLKWLPISSSPINEKLYYVVFSLE
ncbi:hypothetical protein OCV58_06175 [Megasphaera butyrica]|uniref:hypothetical protein n=1 Tax=Megasphaera butyrica TaxID=2981791 RepID=UPI000821B623|nr:hypothetical protein [Megasphaera butyrica]MCU6714494.1 hypothetical protein [Megasphaera butyrica]SCJ02316.1 Uncharacterised protein [uncultured Ruminococcus sp.]